MPERPGNSMPMLQTLPIPGYPGYTINTQGKVFHNGLPKSVMFKPGRAPKLRIQVNHKAREFGLAKLMATLFLPNPRKAEKVVFKDGNANHVQLTNIQWVSNREYVRHNLHPGLSMDIKTKKLPPKLPCYIDTGRVPVEGIPGYFISPAGLLYKGDILLKVTLRKGKAATVRMRHQDSAKLSSFGFATLLAQHFLPNPRKHAYVLFKDRNHHNYSLANIAWVDSVTYMLYCVKHLGGKKIQGNREEAISRCTEENIRMYYKTGDETWLHRYWNRLEKTIKMRQWPQYRAECYLYFVDRAQRFSLYKDPIGLLLLHCRRLRSKEWQEKDWHIPMKILLQTDTCLR